jgi:hypothetical protein
VALDEARVSCGAPPGSGVVAGRPRRGGSGLWTLNRATGFVVVRATSATRPSPVVDPPGAVGGFDGEGVSVVDDTDVDALPGNDEGAAAETRRCTRSGAAARAGGGPAGRASRSRASSVGMSGLGRLRSSTPHRPVAAARGRAGR